MADFIITFEGRTYTWDGDLTVREDAVVAAATGMHFGKWVTVLTDPSDDKYILALQALLWVLKKRAGEQVDLRNLDFSIGAFAKAVGEAMAASEQSPAEEGAVAPKESPTDGSTEIPDSSESRTWSSSPSTSTSVQSDPTN